MARRLIRYRDNSWLAIAAECCWATGLWLSHPFTVMPNFLIKLGASTSLIGALPIFTAAGHGLGMMTFGILARARRTLGPTLGTWHFVAALPHLGLAIIAFAAGSMTAGAGWPLPASILMMAASRFLIPGQLPMYFTFLSRLVPERGRTRFFGLVFSTGTLVGLLGPFVASRHITGVEAAFEAYGRVFLISVTIFVVSTPLFYLMRERASAAPPSRSFRRYLDGLLQLWRERELLRRYLVARLWLGGCFLPLIFLATYSREEAGFGDGAVTLLGYLNLVSQSAGSFVLGHLGSRARMRPGGSLGVLIGSILFILAAVMFASLGPAIPAAVALGAASGMLIASDLTLQPNVLMDLSPREGRTDMLTLGMLALMPVPMVVPPLCGVAIEWLGHRPVFALAALVGLVGVVKLRALERTVAGRG